MSPADVESFTREWNQEVATFVDDVNEVLEESTLYGWALITTANPVRTGRSRASWLITVDQEKDDTKPKASGNKRVYQDPQPPKLKYDFLKNSFLLISNNVEYITYLELGTEKFAPFAMVSGSALAIEKDLERRFSALDNKEY